MEWNGIELKNGKLSLSVSLWNSDDWPSSSHLAQGKTARVVGDEKEEEEVGE